MSLNISIVTVIKNPEMLTLSGWVAHTAYHEKPSVFPGGTPGIT